MTLDDLIQQVDAEELSEQRIAVAAIKQYDVERANEKTAGEEKDKKGDILRHYFQTHPDERELIDHEWNLRAYMQRGGRTNVYEHPNLVKQANPKLYARFEQLGLLRFDDAAVKKALADGTLTHGDFEGIAHDGEKSPSLQVKKL